MEEATWLGVAETAHGRAIIQPHIPQEVIDPVPVLDQSPIHIGQRSYCSDHANDVRVILVSISFKYSKEVFDSCNPVQ
jgi:hypothetical protein